MTKTQDGTRDGIKPTDHTKQEEKRLADKRKAARIAGEKRAAEAAARREKRRKKERALYLKQQAAREHARKEGLDDRERDGA